MAIGIWMGVTGEWIGYPIAGFFGLGVVIFIVQLIPGSAFLRLDSEGFTFCSLYRKTTLPWAAIDGFHVVVMRQTGMKVHELVGFNFCLPMTGARLPGRFPMLWPNAKEAFPTPTAKVPGNWPA